MTWKVKNPERLKWIKEVMNTLLRKPPIVKIGKNCKIHKTVVFYDEGYIMEKDGRGNWVRARTHGDIIIEDNVHIGSHSVIRRGVMKGDVTQIGEDSKLSSFVNVGHDCKIGKHVFIGPHVCLNGRVEIGDHCFIGGHTVIKPKVKIGDNVMVGLGSVVVNDISSGQIVDGISTKVIVGVPAKLVEYKDNYIHPSFKHGKNFKIGKRNIIHENCEVGDNVQIRSFVELRPETKIGNNVYIDSGVRSSGENMIGNNVVLRYGAIIARKVTILGGRKKKPTYISPQVMTIYLTHKHKKQGGTVIGHRAFIGTNATIGPAVKIGDDVVIGAKAYVNKDCPEGIYVGIPARRLEKK